MKIIRCLPLVFLMLCAGEIFAQQGKNGTKTISINNAIVNEYTPLTVNAIAGNSFIKVASSTLNSNGRFTASLAKGDLIMIIQMQGATINGTATDSTWGTITNYNNSGLYEFCEVSGVPDNVTIDINCPLMNNYTSAGKVQVVRVPRLASLTINANDTLTCDTWNGTSGGIVTVEVQGNTIINAGAALNASKKGFRGGATGNNCGGNVNLVFAATYGAGEKGEGIAGYHNDYTVDGGMYGRGAPANGGGGGNSWNSPGGGGANAGDIDSYNGNGNPDIITNPAWKTAWDLEYIGFSKSTSSGGGRGGYSVGSAMLNPLVIGPNNASWDPNFHRSNTGGKGGRPLDYTSGRIFFGGGGGGGHEDNGHGGGGGAGGGIVYILSSGTVGGTGSIVANGQKGQDEISPNELGDGAGGGGGGGTVFVNSTGAISGISITANGGAGGIQIISNSPLHYESEGPGGGGGGGYIAVSNGNITRNTLGGVNGTTSATALTSFPPNGATIGGAGIADATITSSPFSSVAVNISPGVSICGSGSTTLVASGGTSYSWSPAFGLSSSTIANPVASPTVTTTYVVTVSSGTCVVKDSTVVTVNAGGAGKGGNIVPYIDTLCAGDNVTLHVIGTAGALQWQSSTNGISFTDVQGAVTDSLNVSGITQTIYYRVKANGGCSTDSSAAAVVFVAPKPNAGITSVNPSSICSGGSSQLTVTGSAGKILWQSSANGNSFTDIPGATNTVYNAINLIQTTYYRVKATSATCGTDSSSVQVINVTQKPVAGNISAVKDTICSGTIGHLNLAGSSGAVQWQSSSTAGNFTNINGVTSISYATQPLSQSVYFRVIASNGLCTDTSAIFKLVVVAAPVASFTSADSGLQVTFNSSGSTGAQTYTWSFGDNSPSSHNPNPTHTYDTSGTYHVCLTVQNKSNCDFTLCQNVIIFNTGVVNVENHSGWIIFPNPASNNLSISVGSATGKVKEIAIFDLLGRNVLKKEPDNFSTYPTSIDVSGLARGVYYLQIRTGEVNYVQPFMKL